MRTKKQRFLAALGATVMLWGGCADSGEEGAYMPPEQGAQMSYEATIAKLQEELRELRQAQLAQSRAYEERIQALEAMLAAGETAAPVEPLFAYKVEGGGITVTAYLGKDTRVGIPSEIDGLPVLKLGDESFRNAAVEEVVVPAGVREIGWLAFSGCYRLKRVELPATVAVIGYGAFENCPSVLCVVCPSGSYAEAYAKSYGFTVA